MKATSTCRAVAGRGRSVAGRGWGQVVYHADGSSSWPAGVPIRNSFTWSDPIDEQLRHAIAVDRNSSRDIAEAAGLPLARIDRFMQGADCLTLAEAGRVAMLLGLRLADQAFVDGLSRFWEKAGRPAINCPPNRLSAAAGRVARLRRR